MKFLLLSFLVFVLFCLDRTLKYYFLMNPGAIIGRDLFFGQLSFSFEKNYGIAFGLNFGGVFLIALVIIIIMILLGMLFKEYKKESFLFFLSFNLIIFGAISNLIDRIKFGYVIDYIDLPWFTVFNLADCLITVGVILFLFNAWFKRRPLTASA